MQEGRKEKEHQDYLFGFRFHVSHLMCQYSPHEVQPTASPKSLSSLAMAGDKVQRAGWELLQLQTLGQQESV